MKKINIRYLLLSGIIITNYVLDGYAKTNKKNGNSYAGSQNTTGGFNSTIKNSQGQTIRSRTSSNSQESGHSATMTGQKGTVTSTNTGQGTGQHTIENSADTKSKTITNKELLAGKITRKNFASQRSSDNVMAPTQQQSSSHGGSSNWGRLSILASKKSQSTSNKSAMASTVITEGAGLKAAQSAEQSSQSGSGSGSSGSSSTQAFQNNLLNMYETNSGFAVSSNSTPTKPGAPTATAGSTTNSTPITSALTAATAAAATPAAVTPAPSTTSSPS